MVDHRTPGAHAMGRRPLGGWLSRRARAVSCVGRPRARGQSRGRDVPHHQRRGSRVWCLAIDQRGREFGRGCAAALAFRCCRRNDDGGGAYFIRAAAADGGIEDRGRGCRCPTRAGGWSAARHFLRALFIGERTRRVFSGEWPAGSRTLASLLCCCFWLGVAWFVLVCAVVV